MVRLYSYLTIEWRHKLNDSNFAVKQLAALVPLEFDAFYGE